jgi:two-component system chemotaxis response regulator CheY
VNQEIVEQMVWRKAIPNVCVVTQDHFPVMNKPILIIDDDRPVRRALRLLLESHAFDCKEADDGLEGLTLLDGGLTVDLILSDYHMPVIDGLNFLKALAYRVSGQGVPVILLSGNMTKKMEKIAKQAGAFAVIAKPYDPQKLLAVISRACNRPIS